MRWVFLGVLGSAILLLIILESFVLDSPGFDRGVRAIVIHLVMVLSVLLFLLSMKFDSTLLANAIRSASAMTLNSVRVDTAENFDQFDHEDLIQVFEDNNYHREPGLTITQLAHRLSVPEYRLRMLINRHLGFRNFSAMLNHYRIEDACKLLSDAQRRSLSIYSIALEVGYQSISPFNIAFREHKSMTPSEYRKRFLAR